ncbi:MAG: carotenoid biosynthesis protein [Nitriliruptorales bacterium]|nr:carotenoid biosynthesis protein [Nitriliruptorales bacterium]
MDEVVGTLVGRWYVTLFGIVFFWRASRDLGWRRTGIYFVGALLVGVISENASVRWGIPYTGYEFNQALKGEELFIGEAPLMVSFSYTFMGYFAYAGGRLLASGPWRTRGRRTWHELALGVMLAVWAVFLFDPIAQLGDQWFLGEVFAYDGDGFWFGLPVMSQVGMFFMSLLTVGLATWLGRDQADEPVDGLLRHPHFVALLTYHGQLVWLGTTAVWLGETELGGSVLLMWVPAALVTAVAWSNQRAARAAEVT